MALRASQKLKTLKRLQPIKLAHYLPSSTTFYDVSFPKCAK